MISVRQNTHSLFPQEGGQQADTEGVYSCHNTLSRICLLRIRQNLHLPEVIDALG